MPSGGGEMALLCCLEVQTPLHNGVLFSRKIPAAQTYYLLATGGQDEPVGSAVAMYKGVVDPLSLTTVQDPRAFHAVIHRSDWS
jgi:hypothetical protein